MFVKRKLLNIAVLGSLGLAGSAQAVYLGEDSTGEVLVYPYYTVRDNYFTLMSVVNTTDSAKAVKVRFLEAKNSREVIDFNLYLSANDVWTGAIEITAAGAKLSTTDASCTVPAIATNQGGTGSVEFRNVEYTGTRADGEDTSLNRTREGYIEIIEMGEIIEDTTITKSSTGTITLHDAVTHAAGVPGDCGAVRKAWTTGGAFLTSTQTFFSEPDGGLFGGASLIRTDIGTDYTYDAIAMDDWSDTADHTEPGSLSPTLASVSPKVSIVFNSGAAVTSNWSGLIPADPVSAILMRTAVMNEYTVESIVNASTDWIITFPTKKFYVFTDSTSSSNADTTDRFFERPFSDDFWTGGACEQISLIPFDREEDHPAEDVDFSPRPETGKNNLCWEVNVLTFNGGNLFGSDLSTNTNVSVPYQYGWMYVSFPSGTGNVLHTGDGNASNSSTASGWNEPTRRLISNNGDTYSGLPVVGFMAQEFVRGDGSLDNYGGTFVHKYERSITPGIQ